MATEISFKVHRREPELVTPVKPTPRELKLLSDIDDQQGIRFHVPLIFPYGPTSSNHHHQDPVVVIKKALAETLVYYYPFSGRLWEGPNRKLTVDCTGEGVLFIEADADVAFAELQEADALLPPFPCFEELLFHVEGSNEMLNTPLILFQVTRLKCGGFIFALRFNHSVTDRAGISLFLEMLSELARGIHTPSVLPVWDRHLLTARVPPCVTHPHREYEEEKEVEENQSGLVTRSFFFGDGEIFAIRKLFPSAHKSTSFEMLTTLLWRCRTIALSPDPNAEMWLTCAVNALSRLSNPPLQLGYYGNLLTFPVAIATARDLTEKPLVYALRLIQQAMLSVTEDYVRSVADLMATRGRPKFVTAGNYLVSDFRCFDFGNVDFGPWGEPVYGGIARAGNTGFSGVSFYMLFKNRKGETGIVVPICLPALAMDRFVRELDDVFKGQNGTKNPKKFSMSSL